MQKLKVYVASSWRNEFQPHVVNFLSLAGHEVYDFRNPVEGEHGFGWEEIDPNWQQWDLDKFRSAIVHPIAQHGFARDMDALRECEACVLVLPCGRSAHLELGWAVGAGKHSAVYCPKGVRTEPELMYAMTECITNDLHLLSRKLESWKFTRIGRYWGEKA